MRAERDDRDLRILAAGREFVVRWIALLKAVRLYEPGNRAIHDLAQRIGDLVAEILDGGVDLDVAIRQECLFVEGRRIKEGAVASVGYRQLVGLFRACRVGRFRLDAEVTPAELDLFARLLLETSEGCRGPDQLVPELQVRGAGHIEVELAEGDEELPDEVDAEQVARRVYLRAIGVVKNVFQDARGDDRISARRVKRVVQEMIESLDGDPGYLLNLSTLKNYDEYTFNHSVNVSVLAIALGRRVGLSRRQLYLIGQAGMLHDLGKLCVPKQVLNKPGRLTPDERILIQNHPVEGFLSVASQLGVSADAAVVALGAYEHHLNEDGTGYPSCASGRRRGIPSRVVAIVDRYDAMTSARVYRAAPIPPPKTLSIMYYSQRGHHDEVLLRTFMNMMGFYPLGTTVRLSDSSVAVVVGSNAEGALRHFPVVKMVLEPDGRPASGATLDLAASAKESDPLRVVEVLNPGDYGIEIMDYIL